MIKNKFLKELEKRLDILNESELDDIINEYRDIIEEKIRHGKTEKEAVEDFGSIDDLVKEILEAYKINPNYNKSELNAQEIIDKGEDFIKRSATYLANSTKKIINNIKNSKNPLTIENIFEMMIKAILLLIGFAILTIPFTIIKEIGVSILEFSFLPLGYILIFVWSLIVNLFYIITCILISILVFKDYFQTYEDMVVSNKITDKKNIQTEKINKEEVKANNINQNSTVSIFKNIFNIFVVIIILVPSILVSVGLLSAITVMIFFLVQGVPLFGPILILFGILWIVNYIIKVIYKVINGKQINKFWPITIAIPLIIVGGLITFNEVLNITYYDDISTYHYRLNTDEYNEVITNQVTIQNYTNGKIVYSIDNNLPDNNIKVEINQYKELTDIFISKSSNKITINNRFKKSQVKNFIKILIHDLKEKSIYDYSKFSEASIVIYVNENTISKVSGIEKY